MKIEIVVLRARYGKIKLSNYEKTFLTVLEDDVSFQNRISSIRKRLNIPTEGINIDRKNINPNLLSDVIVWMENSDEVKRIVKITHLNPKKLESVIEKEVLSICLDYSMHYQRWRFSIGLFIIYNLLITYIPEVSPINLVTGKDVITGHTDYTRGGIFGSQMFLEIDEKTNLTEALENLKRLWPKIEKGFLKYKYPEYSVPRIMTQSVTLNIQRLIFQLRIREKKSFTEIADKISEKYDKQFSDTQANIYLTRYLRTINKLKKDNSPKT